MRSARKTLRGQAGEFLNTRDDFLPFVEKFAEQQKGKPATKNGFRAGGSSHVYASGDAADSAFYIGRGKETARTNLTPIGMDDSPYYIAKFLGGTCTVDILRTGLSPDGAEFLEAQLIEDFGRQLLNWGGNLGTMLAAAAMRKCVSALEESRLCPPRPTSWPPVW